MARLALLFSLLLPRRHILFVLAFVSVRGPLPCFLFPPPPPFSVETTKKETYRRGSFFVGARAVCVCVCLPLFVICVASPPPLTPPSEEKKPRVPIFDDDLHKGKLSRECVCRRNNGPCYVYMGHREGGREKKKVKSVHISTLHTYIGISQGNNRYAIICSSSRDALFLRYEVSLPFSVLLVAPTDFVPLPSPPLFCLLLPPILNPGGALLIIET